METTAGIDYSMVTTSFELEGFTVTKHIGVVRGIVVRSRSIVGSFGAGIQTIFGGNITLYEEMCERAREQAFERMVSHAAEKGGNAIVGVRYDATELMPGITEVLAYGTAVQVSGK